MNIYLLKQDMHNNYDKYDSCVVCAESQEEAIMIHPWNKKGHDGWFTFNDAVNGWIDEEYIEGKDVYKDNSWCNPKYVTVTLIGTSKEGLEKGVVCASFNAG